MPTDYYSLSDAAVAQLLGRRVRALRLRRDRTQEEVAASAAVSVGTIKNLEAGKGKLETLIAVLRELGALDALDGFIPEPTVSPVQLARRQGRPRRRASGKHAPSPQDDTEADSSW
jgi:transcriptional regulator with XRE-family HTH domain